jgi:hypothetical protein
MGLFTAITITLHNFPEGVATFLAALEDPITGIAIAAAVALHNIPEGISVSVPIFSATGRRRKAFIFSLFSGLAEPLGALVAMATLGWLIPLHILGPECRIQRDSSGVTWSGSRGRTRHIPSYQQLQRDTFSVPLMRPLR